jgi:hypothetical protein
MISFVCWAVNGDISRYFRRPPFLLRADEAIE